MKANIKLGIAFAAGCGTGFLGGWLTLKNKYKVVRAARLKEVEEAEEKQTPDLEDVDSLDDDDDFDEEPMPNNAEDILAQYNAGANIPTETTKNIIPDEDMYEDPYVINDIDYGSEEDYEMLTWHLYSNGEVRNDEGILMTDEDINHYIGPEALNHLTNSYDDSIYVRNPRLRTDFEILINEGRYEDRYEI